MIAANQLAAILSMVDPHPALDVLRRLGVVSPVRGMPCTYICLSYDACYKILTSPGAEADAGPSSEQNPALVTLPHDRHLALKRHLVPMYRETTWNDLVSEVDATLQALLTEPPELLSVARDLAAPIHASTLQAISKALGRDATGILWRSLTGGADALPQQIVNTAAAWGRWCRDDPTRHWGASAAECMRLMPAVPVVKTQLHEAVAIGDFLLPSGSNVFCILLAANRDPDVFTDPHVYRATRDARKPLTFSAGRHSCVGKFVTTLLMEVLLERLTAAHESSRLEMHEVASLQGPTHGPSDVLISRWTKGAPA